MEGQKEVIYERFDGGISDDIREKTLHKFSRARHFDTVTNPNRLVPYRSPESDSSGQVSIGNFLYSSNGYLLGLGKVSGQNWPQVYFKTGANLVTDNWDNKSNWIGTTQAVYWDTFVEYHDYFYFWTGSALVKGDTTFSVGLDETYKVITTTYRAQGLVHSTSDTLYLPYSTGGTGADSPAAGTYIASLNGSTFTAAALTLPSDVNVTSLAEYGQYLAIACIDTTTLRSRVFLWDMVSSDVTETIDWGDGYLYVLNNLEGALVGVSVSPSSVFSLTTSRLKIQRYAGGMPTTVKEVIVSASNSITIYPRVNFVRNNRLYFSAKLATGDVGLWTYGRKTSSREYSLTYDRSATTDYSETSLPAAFLVDDVCWTVHSSEGTITRTNDQAVFSTTSIYESQKFSDYPNAKLDEVRVNYANMSTGGQVVVKYRKDAETSWTEIFTDGDDNATSHIASRIESTGGNQTFARV